MNKEDKMIEVQGAIGTEPDGLWGEHTADVLYRWVAKETGSYIIDYPYYGRFWGCDVIVGTPDKIQIVNGEGKLSLNDFDYAITGTFTSPSGVKPWGIMINDGEYIWDRSSHANTEDGEKPETLLYYTKDGEFGTTLSRTKYDLDISNIKWGISGYSLINDGKLIPESYNREVEGFDGRFDDVFRYTGHNCIGYDIYGNVIGFYTKGDREDCQRRGKNIGLISLIALDGGSPSGINTPDKEVNVYNRQGSIINFGG